MNRHLLVVVLLGLAKLGWAEDVARMKQAVDARAEGNAFMGSALVARGDQVVFEASRGWANAEWKIPHTPGTKFRLGSVTKQFTAAAILLLEEQGKLSIEDPISKFIPNAPATWQPVTIHQLLNHTGGIPNFTELSDYASNKLSPLSPAEVMARMADQPLTAPPGHEFRYSNTGYILLGWIVEIASGTPYPTFLRDHVFGPLGMKESGYDSSSTVLPERAAGYVNGPNGLQNAPYIDMHIPGGAGGLYSTTHDLVLWTNGLFGGRLISAASLAKMTTPGKENYGFGIAISHENGPKAYVHNGGIEGFNSFLAYYPDPKLTVVVLQNVNGDPSGLAQELTKLALGKSVTLASERKAIDVPSAVLERYTGVYQVSPELTNTVRLKNGQLTTQLTGQPAFPLYPESQTTFYLRVVEASCEFVADAGGRATAVIMHQNGQATKAPRVSDAPPEVAAKAIADSEPDVTATIRNIFVAAQAGKVDATLFTPQLAAIMQQQLAPGMGTRQTLDGLGTQTGIELLERKAHSGQRIYRYRLRYEHGAILVTCGYDASGKIAGLRFVPE